MNFLQTSYELQAVFEQPSDEALNLPRVNSWELFKFFPDFLVNFLQTFTNFGKPVTNLFQTFYELQFKQPSNKALNLPTSYEFVINSLQSS